MAKRSSGRKRPTLRQESAEFVVQLGYTPPPMPELPPGRNPVIVSLPEHDGFFTNPAAYERIEARFDGWERSEARVLLTVVGQLATEQRAVSLVQTSYPQLSDLSGLASDRCRLVLEALVQLGLLASRKRGEQVNIVICDLPMQHD